MNVIMMSSISNQFLQFNVRLDISESVLSTVSVSDESYVKYKDILSPRRKEKLDFFFINS